jgi:hypothetical protein
MGYQTCCLVWDKRKKEQRDKISESEFKKELGVVYRKRDDESVSRQREWSSLSKSNGW